MPLTSNESTERIPVIREVSTDFSSRFSFERPTLECLCYDSIHVVLATFPTKFFLVTSLTNRSNQKQIESNETSRGTIKEENYSMRNYYNFYSIVSINLSYIMYRLNFHYYGSCYFIPRKKRNIIFHRVNKISEGEKMMKLIFFPKSSRFRKWIDH